MRQNRLFACPEPLEGGEDNLTVFFCIPDTPGWRQTITAMVSLLSYGRSWDESTGNIKNTQEIGKEIFESMSMCDIETQLTRIADALDGGAAERYSIADIVTALEEIDTGLDVVDFLDMFEFWTVLISKFPNLDLTLSLNDLFKMLTEFRFRASSLNYLEDIALSQRGNMIAQGGVPIQAIYENIGDLFNTAAAGLTGGQSAGIQWLFQVVKGKDIQIGQDLLDFLNGLLFGSIRDANYDIGSDVNDLQTALEALVLQVTNNVDVQPPVNNFNPVNNIDVQPPVNNFNPVNNITNNIDVEASGNCDCGGVGCSNCREGGVVETVVGLSPDPCEPPVGFTSWEDYTAYKCNAANRIYDDLSAMVLELSDFYQWFKANHGVGGQYLNPIETYNRIGNFLPDSMANPIEYTLSPSQTAALKQNMNDLYTNFHRANVLDNWTDFQGNVASFFGLFDAIQSQMETDQATIVQSLFDASDQAAAFSYLDNYLDTVFAALDPYGGNWSWPDENLAAIKLCVTTGFLNVLFFNSSFAQNYSAAIPCTGNMGCCLVIWPTVGTQTGSVFQSVLVGQYWTFEGFIDVDEPSYAGACGADVQPTFTDVTGWTSIGTGESYEIWDTNQQLLMQEDNFPPQAFECGRFFRVRSTTQFSFECTEAGCE